MASVGSWKTARTRISNGVWRQVPKTKTLSGTERNRARRVESDQDANPNSSEGCVCVCVQSSRFPPAGKPGGLPDSAFILFDLFSSHLGTKCDGVMAWRRTI
ncbi:hypothetical protein AMECASPLE_031757 [Ameca splendens]|uniref:Uncharacterized protein n=1 Tax=Ameca splendens TaxID=208324 RepID=A0ABV0Z5Y7_9TELE